jgi:hypothetical protein
MKNKFLIVMFILIPSLSFCIAKEGEDLQTIDNLIASTERQLVIYKDLQALMAEFQKQQDLFHEDQQTPQAAPQTTKELAIQMIQTASKILRIAQDHQLLYLFTPFFVEELKLFAGITKKKAP